MITASFKTFQKAELKVGNRLRQKLQGLGEHPSRYRNELVRGSIYLFANNPEARVCFAKACLDTLAAFFEITPDADCANRAVYHVTLAPRRFCCPLGKAADTNLRPLQAWVRQMMQGHSYIGMVEAAYYSNWDLEPGGKDKTVSWHVHLLVWGASRASLKTLVDEINERHDSLIPFLRAADYRKIPSSLLIDKALYMLKSPQEYRVWLGKREVVDPDTGEIVLQPSGRYRQRSRPLRPIDQVRVYRFMRDRYLDHMMVGGGTGSELLKAIRRKALEPLHSRQRIEQP
jgi:hypothetical protein